MGCRDIALTGSADSTFFELFLRMTGSPKGDISTTRGRDVSRPYKVGWQTAKK